MRQKKIIVFLICLSLISAYSGAIDVFAANEPSSWAAAEINAAIEAGIVPKDLVTDYQSEATRGEFAGLVMQSLRVYYKLSNDELLLKYGRKIVPNTFSDTGDNDVLTANALGLISGFPDGTYLPGAGASRAQTATLLTRAAILKGIKPNSVPMGFADAGDFPDYSRDSIAFISAVQNVDGNKVMAGSNGIFGANRAVTLEQLIVTVYRLHTAYASGDQSAAWSMAYVQGGAFAPGKNISGGSETGNTPNVVTLSDFYISNLEVTQKDFAALMGFNPSGFTGDSLPVHQVTWYDAVTYCNLLSEKNGLPKVYTVTNALKNDKGNITSADVSANWEAPGYRLPTEAEFVYAAYGGQKSKGYKYSGGDELDAVAWYAANAGETGIKGPRAAGGKLMNELGLYDMSGNVSEWCWDWYGADYYKNAPKENPRGPDTGSARVRMGGSWRESGDACVSGSRGSGEPNSAENGVGFRVARSFDAAKVVTQVVKEPVLEPTGVSGRSSVKPPSVRIDEAFVQGTGNTPVMLGPPSELMRILQNNNVPATFQKYVTGAPEDYSGGPIDPVANPTEFPALISSFYIGKFEVTQEEFMAVMGYNPSRFSEPGHGRYPAERVTFYEAAEFCNRLSDMYGYGRVYTMKTIDIVHTGQGTPPDTPNRFDQPCECDLGSDCVYTPGEPSVVDVVAYADFTENGFRLPTEIEWEYAARGGVNQDSYIYSGSDDLNEVAVHSAPYTNPFSGAIFEPNSASTQPVGSKRPNSLDIYDMTGNVTEWCLNCPGRSPATNNSVYDYAGDVVSQTRNDIRHAIRGGAWNVGNNSQFEVFYRYSRSGAVINNTAGFRVVRSYSEGHIDGMKLVQGGTYTMGTSDNSKVVLPRNFVSSVPDSSSDPSLKDDGVKVKVSNIYMGETEVTQREFERYMGFNPSALPNPDAPVENVTWYDAVAFCNEKSMAFGFGPFYSLDIINIGQNGNITDAAVSIASNSASYAGYRLPTEAEWLLAARGGAISTGHYMHSMTVKRLEFHFPGSVMADDVAWCNQSAAQSVGLLKPNEFGLYDMSGNVAEWCYDWWDGDYLWLRTQTDVPVISPPGPAVGSEKVVMGGSYSDTPQGVSIAANYTGNPNQYFDKTEPLKEPRCKSSASPGSAQNGIGFRVVYTGPRN